MPKGRPLLVLAALLVVTLVGGCFLLPNRPPDASFVVRYDLDPADPMVVELDASASLDPDDDLIVAYLWTFGDDVTILTPLEHSKHVVVPVLRVRYPVEDTYDVTLLVRDDQGNSSAPVSGTVTVPNVPVGTTD
ncbi:MAG: PKD domain-containing protein [Candidatus Bipolaricaulia bacterium]